MSDAVWRYPDFVEAWASRISAPVSAAPSPAGSPLPTFDISDPDAAQPMSHGCFTDTSGFN
jgi:hypothetical protein